MGIPVTIITGFLGAGKTSLLNHIIEQHPESRFAIIENEFGDIAIDNDLVIQDGSGEGIFELSNGCICCEMNDELLQTLGRLVKSGKSFDHLLIETTGMAEPDGVAAAFMADATVQEHFRLDAVICVTDAGQIEDMLEEREEARRQLAFADVVVLNKQNTISAAYLDKVQTFLAKSNPFAEIYRADYGKVPSTILQQSAYESEAAQQKLMRAVEEAAAHDHHHHHHHHEGVEAHSFTLTKPLDMLKFIHWSKFLLLMYGKNIYRIKGILHFQTESQPVVFQSVRTQFAFERMDTWPEGTNGQSRIVFIANNVKREVLEKGLASLAA
jgi:G3E family GTPase